MKNRLLFLLWIGGLFLYACSDHEPGSDDTDAVTVATLDTWVDHLTFHGALKKEGKAPGGTAGALKFSIRDTLHLFPGGFFPVKFLHDTTSDVTGVFFQVTGVVGGPVSSFYFDVPEVPMDNDSVSVVVIGFDPTKPGVADVDLPLSFNITLVPHNDNGQPLDGGTIPVKIEKRNDKSSSAACGLTGGYWKWLFKYGEFPNSQNVPGFDFYNDPYKKWLKTGQLIGGCCCKDSSSYNVPCPCAENGISNAILHFSTYLQYKEETLTFNENGTFFRQTLADTPYPDPLASDFCANAGGVVRDDLSRTTYNGNWAATVFPVPENLVALGYPTEMNSVELDQTSQDPKGGGYGNGGGWIGMMDCRVLVLLGVDPEGTGEAFWTIYERKSDFQETDEADWYDIPES
jgi:hypothetical protein